MGKQTVRFEGTNITGVTCSVTDEFEPTVFVKVYNYILALFFVCMCVTMNVSYGQIACFLRQHNKRSRNSQSSNKLPGHSAGCEVKLEMSIEVCQDSQDDQTANTLPTTESKLVGLSSNQIRIRQMNTKCKVAVPKNGTNDLQKISNQPLCGDFKASNHDEVRNKNKMDYTQQQNSTPSKRDHSETSEAIYSDSITATVVDSQDDYRTVVQSARIVSQNPVGVANPSSISKRTSSKSTPNKRSTVSGGKKIPKRTTLMLFVVSVVFVVNFVPFLILELIEKLKPSLVAGIEENIFLILTNTQYINSAANPLVYILCSDKFRNDCRKLFDNVLQFFLRRFQK